MAPEAGPPPEIDAPLRGYPTSTPATAKVKEFASVAACFFEAASQNLHVKKAFPKNKQAGASSTCLSWVLT